MLLHDSDEFPDLIAVVARAEGIDPGLVEKDYWIMHSLWGLQQLGLVFELKGGTSLSKGFGIIERFSEDIDIQIHPETALPVGRNQNKPGHVAARRDFYNGLAERIEISGIREVTRDEIFDDQHLRSAGIRLYYNSVNPLPDGVKQGILLEAGFDQVAPNRERMITSWAYERAATSGIDDLTDNRAHDVPCYEPGYTFVEKLQTISTKYRRHLEDGGMPQNFMRHYYDVYCLLADESVQNFIGTEAYTAHKVARFPAADEVRIARNPAFRLEDDATRARFATAYEGTQSLYYRGQPSLETILGRISEYLDRL